MKTIKILKPYLAHYKAGIALTLVFAALSVGCKMAVPFLTGISIDHIRQGDFEIGGYLIAMACLVLFGMAFRYCFDYLLARLGQLIIKELRDDVYLKLLRVPVGFLDKHYHGDLVLRLIGDIENVQTGFISGVGAVFEGVVQIVITLAFIFTLNWILGLVVVLATPLSIFVSKFISGHNARYFKDQNAALGELHAFTLETMNNIECLKGYGKENAWQTSFDEKSETVHKANFKATFAACWVNPGTRFVNNTIYASVILLGAWMILSPSSFTWSRIAFTVGGLSSFLTYTYQYMAPFNEIADATGDILNASSSLKRIEEVLLTEDDVDEGKETQLEQIDGLKADHITFGYDKNHVIIDDFSVDIKKGQKIALVGTTGCGKTTIINLLMRFYDPDQGGFFTGDKISKDYPKKLWRSHFGMVLQDTWLAHASIKDNIAFGREKATMEEIVKAAKKAKAHEFITRLKDGYDTVVGEGLNLSSGEKQLLCVARILMVESEIILLDEATSNIDLRTELALSASFDALMKGKTSIVVAHRLSTIKNADVILMMDKGKIIEKGSFAELLKKDGAFASLYKSQFA